MNKHAAGVVSVLSLAVALSTTGCTGIGTVAPQNTEQRLAYSEGTVTAVREAAANALLAGTITREQAQKVLQDTDAARMGIDVARSLEASGDTSGAKAKLDIAASLLAGVQAILRGK